VCFARAQAQDDQEGKKERKFACVQMGARINGKDLGIESVAQLPIESEDDILYPGVSLVRAEAVTLNFGYRPFVYATLSSCVCRGVVCRVSCRWSCRASH
jgi:hypothetical protein